MPNAAIRQEYQDRSSCLRYLYESGARQQLTDFFLELGAHWDEDCEAMTKKEIISATGLQRRSIIDHIDALVEMGIVNEVDGYQWTRYEPAIEKETYDLLIQANNTLGDYFEEYKKDDPDHTS